MIFVIHSANRTCSAKLINCLLVGHCVKNQWRSKKNTQAEDNSTNPSDPPKNRPNEDKGKDPPIHTSNQREESSAINLSAALDDDVLDEIPPDELKNTTIDQTKKSPTIVANSERRKIWTKVTVRVNDEVSTLTPTKNIPKEGQSQNKDVEFASPNLSSIELNYGRSCTSTMSSITVSPSIKNTSPALKSFSHNF